MMTASLVETSEISSAYCWLVVSLRYTTKRCLSRLMGFRTDLSARDARSLAKIKERYIVYLANFYGKLLTAQHITCDDTADTECKLPVVQEEMCHKMSLTT